MDKTQKFVQHLQKINEVCKSYKAKLININYSKYLEDMSNPIENKTIFDEYGGKDILTLEAFEKIILRLEDRISVLTHTNSSAVITLQFITLGCTIEEIDKHINFTQSLIIDDQQIMLPYIKSIIYERDETYKCLLDLTKSLESFI